MTKCTTLANAISSVTATYGVDILKDGNRFCSILGDIAPGLEKERKILRRAKDEDVFCLLLDAYHADTSKRASIISKIEYTLKSEAGFSDEWYLALMTGFSEAFSWTLPVTKTATVTPTATAPTAPATKKKYFTKNIARNSFSTSPKQILLPEKYNAVGEHAFDYIGLSVHVDSITIPNGYVEIQRYAFHPLKIDQFISIPDSVIEIADNAFTLEKYAYVLCSPNSYAYQYCTKNYLANSVDGIPQKPVFSRLDKDDSAQIDTVSSTDELLNTKYQEVIIPPGTTSVEKGAFRNRNDIELVFSDNKLQFIKKGAFANCTSLQCVYLGTGVRNIASEAFANCSNLRIVFIDRMGDWSSQFDAILDRSPETISISDSAFHGCAQLRYIVSPSYSTELDNICKSLNVNYVYDDISLGKKSAVTLPNDLRHLYGHVVHRAHHLYSSAY